MNDLCLRAATINDAVQLSKIESLSTERPWSARQYRESIISGHRVDIAQKHEKTLGAIAWLLIIDEIDLLNIFVSKEQQRQGIGRWLINNLIKEAISLHVARIILEVRFSNEPAQKLYLSNGFVKCGLRKDYYPLVNGHGREDAILMEHKL